MILLFLIFLPLVSMAAVQEVELASPPTDGVSGLSFSPRDALLAASSWDTDRYLPFTGLSPAFDLLSPISWENHAALSQALVQLFYLSHHQSVSIYDVSRNQLRSRYQHKAPVLACTFSDMAHIYSGGVDRYLKQFEIQTQTESVLGEHEKPIKAISYCPFNQLLVTGSWDGTMKVWDNRAEEPCIGTYRQPGRVFTMSMAGHRVIVGTSSRHVWIWDLRRMAEAEQRRESSLKHQTRVLHAYIENDGFAIGSTEGRIAMEYLDPSPQIQARKYAFKCHRVKGADGVENVYPVNSMAFHPIHGTFASGGGDGIVNVWDGRNRKRLSQFHKYPSSIAALSFSADGAMLAIASSYCYEQGDAELGREKDRIFIRAVTESEVAPKART